jgi:hypothetical protein
MNQAVRAYTFEHPHSTVAKQFKTLGQMVGNGDVTFVFQVCAPEPSCDQTTITFGKPTDNAATHPLSAIQRMDTLFNSLPFTNGFTAEQLKPSEHDIAVMRVTYPIGHKAKAGYNNAIYKTAIQSGAICAVTSCLVNFAKHYKTFTPLHFRRLCAEVGKHLNLSLPAANHQDTTLLLSHRDGLLGKIGKKSHRNRASRVIGDNVTLAHRDALNYVKKHGLDCK